MSLDESVPRAADAQEELHESVEQLGIFTDLLAEARGDFPEVESVRSDYDRFANGVADYMENEAEDLQGYLGELMALQIGEDRRNFMSPVFNFGGMDETPSGGFMSPIYNFGSLGNETDVEQSWSEYEWGGWSQIREPEVEDPSEIFGGRREYGFGDTVIYNPQFVSSGHYESSRESQESQDIFEGMDMPWGPNAS